MSTISIRRETPSVTGEKPRHKTKAKKNPDEVLSQKAHHQPVETRRALAKAIRKRCPREELGGWKAPKKRRDPIDILIESSKGRIEELVPIRYGRMLASPFAFYRGAAAIMASDLASTKRTNILLQICGDCHLVNFGGFATPERKLVFDINDFDETSIGPWEWDVKRLTASMVVAARSNGFSKSHAEESAWTAASSYRNHMDEYAHMPLLEAWYDQLDLQDIIHNIQDDEAKKLVKRRVEKASAATAHTREFVKFAVAGGEPPTIRDEPPLIFHDRSVSAKKWREEIDRAFASYRSSLSPERCVLLDRFKYADFAVKVVGVGSVGTYCGIMLMVSGTGDPLFLQVKEARASVLAPYIGKEIYGHQGERVVIGQRLMQSASDIFLGWTQTTSRQYYVRQLRDAKIVPEIELMKAQNLIRYGALCGHALARAHVRSGDALMLSAYLGKSDAFADAMTSFATAYADQNERDHEAMVSAVRSGRIDAVSLSD